MKLADLIKKLDELPREYLEREVLQGFAFGEEAIERVSAINGDHTGRPGAVILYLGGRQLEPARPETRVAKS